MRRKTKSKRLAKKSGRDFQERARGEAEKPGGKHASCLWGKKRGEKAPYSSRPQSRKKYGREDSMARGGYKPPSYEEERHLFPEKATKK